MFAPTRFSSDICIILLFEFLCAPHNKPIEQNVFLRRNPTNNTVGISESWCTLLWRCLHLRAFSTLLQTMNGGLPFRDMRRFAPVHSLSFFLHARMNLDAYVLGVVYGCARLPCNLFTNLSILYLLGECRVFQTHDPPLCIRPSVPTINFADSGRGAGRSYRVKVILYDANIWEVGSPKRRPRGQKRVATGYSTIR